MSLELFAQQIITTPPSPTFSQEFIRQISDQIGVLDFQLQNNTFLHGTTLFGLICKYQHYDIAKHFLDIGLGNDSIEISSHLSIFTTLCAIDPIPVELFLFLLHWYDSITCPPQISFTTLATWLSHPILTSSHIQFALLVFKRIAHTAQTIFDTVALITNSIHYDEVPLQIPAISFSQTTSPFTTPQPTDQTDPWLPLFQYQVFQELESFAVEFFKPELITDAMSRFYYHEHRRLIVIREILENIIRLNVYLTSIRKYGPIVSKIAAIMKQLKQCIRAAGFDCRSVYIHLSQVILTHEYFTPHYALFRYNFPLNQYAIDLFEELQTTLPLVPNFMPDPILQPDPKLGMDPMYTMYPLSQPRGARRGTSDQPIECDPYSSSAIKFNKTLTEPAFAYESDPSYYIETSGACTKARNANAIRYELEMITQQRDAPEHQRLTVARSHCVLANIPNLHQFSAYPILPPLPVFITSIMNYFIHTQYPMLNTTYTLQFKLQNQLTTTYKSHQLLNTIPQLPNPFNLVKSTPAQILPSQKVLDDQLSGTNVDSRNEVKYSTEYRFIHTPTQFRLIPRNTPNNSLWPPYLPYDIYQNPTVSPLPALVKLERKKIKKEERQKGDTFTKVIQSQSSGVHIEDRQLQTAAKYQLSPNLYPNVINDILSHHETVWTPEHLHPLNKGATAFKSPAFPHVTGAYSPYDAFGCDDISNIPRRLPFPFLPWQSWNRLYPAFILDRASQRQQEFAKPKMQTQGEDYKGLTYANCWPTKDLPPREEVSDSTSSNHGLFERHFTVAFRKKGFFSKLFGSNKDEGKRKDPSRKQSYIVEELCVDDDLSDAEFENEHNTDPFELKRKVKKLSDITCIDDISPQTKELMQKHRITFMEPIRKNTTNLTYYHSSALSNTYLLRASFLQMFSAMKFFKKFHLQFVRDYFAATARNSQFNPLIPYINHPLRRLDGYVIKVDDQIVASKTAMQTRPVPLSVWTVFDTNFNKNVSSNYSYISIYDYTNPNIIFSTELFKVLVDRLAFFNFDVKLPDFVMEGFGDDPFNAFYLQYQYGIVNNHHISLPALAHYYKGFGHQMLINTKYDVERRHQYRTVSANPANSWFLSIQHKANPYQYALSHAPSVGHHSLGYLLGQSQHIMFHLLSPLASLGTDNIFTTEQQTDNKLVQDEEKQLYDKMVTILEKTKSKGKMWQNRVLDNREPKCMTEMNISFESTKFRDTTELRVARDAVIEQLAGLTQILCLNSMITNYGDTSNTPPDFGITDDVHITANAIQGFLCGYAANQSKLWNPFIYLFFATLYSKVSPAYPLHYNSLIGRNIFLAGQQLNTVLGLHALQQTEDVNDGLFELIASQTVPFDLPYLNDAIRTLLWGNTRDHFLVRIQKYGSKGQFFKFPLRPQMFSRINVSLWDWASPVGISLTYWYLMWFVQFGAYINEDGNAIDDQFQTIYDIYPFFQFVYKIWIFFPFMKSYHRLSVTSQAHANVSLYSGLKYTPFECDDTKQTRLSSFRTSLQFPVISPCLQDSSVYHIPSATPTTPVHYQPQTSSTDLCPFASIPSAIKSISNTSNSSIPVADTINTPLFDANGIPVDLTKVPENQTEFVSRYLQTQIPITHRLDPLQTNLYADHTFHYNHQNTTQFLGNEVNANTFLPTINKSIVGPKPNHPNPDFNNTDPRTGLPQSNGSHDYLRNKATEYQLQVIEDLLHYIVFVAFKTQYPPESTTHQQIVNAYHASDFPAKELVKQDKLPVPSQLPQWLSNRTTFPLQMGNWLIALNKYDPTIQQYVNYPIINTSLIKYLFFTPLNPYLQYLFTPKTNLFYLELQLLKQRNQHHLYHHLLLYSLMGWDSYDQKEFTEGDYLSFWKPFLDILGRNPDENTSIKTYQAYSSEAKPLCFSDIWKQIPLDYSGDVDYGLSEEQVQDAIYGSEPDTSFTPTKTSYLQNNLLTMTGLIGSFTTNQKIYSDTPYWAYTRRTKETRTGLLEYATIGLRNIPVDTDTISHWFTTQEPYRTASSNVFHSSEQPWYEYHSTTQVLGNRHVPYAMNCGIDPLHTFSKSLTPPLFNVSYQTYPSRLFQSKLNTRLIDFLDQLFTRGLLSIAQNILIVNHTLDFRNVAHSIASTPPPDSSRTAQNDEVWAKYLGMKNSTIFDSHNFRRAGGLDQNSPATHFPGAPAFKQPFYRSSIMEFLTNNGFINGYQYALHFITQSHYDSRFCMNPSDNLVDTPPRVFLSGYDGLSYIFDNPINNLLVCYGANRVLWHPTTFYQHIPIFYVDILRNFIQSILAKQYANNQDSISRGPSVLGSDSGSNDNNHPTIGITSNHLALLNMLFEQNQRFISKNQGTLFGETSQPWSEFNKGGYPKYEGAQLVDQCLDVRGIDTRKIFYNNNYEPNCVFLIQESLALLLHYYSFPLTLEFSAFVDVLLEKATYIQPGVLFCFLTNSSQQHNQQYFALFKKLIKYLTPPNDSLFQHLTQVLSNTPIITLFGPLMGSNTPFTNKYTLKIIYTLLSYGMPYDYPYTQRDQLANISVSGESKEWKPDLPDNIALTGRTLKRLYGDTRPKYKELYPECPPQKADSPIPKAEWYHAPQLNESAILAYLQWTNLFTFDTSEATRKYFAPIGSESQKIRKVAIKSFMKWPESGSAKNKTVGSPGLPRMPKVITKLFGIADDEDQHYYLNQAKVDPRSTFFQLHLDPTRFSNELSQPAFTLLLTLAQVDITQLTPLTITPDELESKRTEVARLYAAPTPKSDDTSGQTAFDSKLSATATAGGSAAAAADGGGGGGGGTSSSPSEYQYDQNETWSQLLYERAVLLNTQPELRRFCQTMTSIWFYTVTRQYSTSLYSIGKNRELNTRYSYRGLPQQYNRQYLDLFPANRYKSITQALMFNNSLLFQQAVVLHDILRPFQTWFRLKDTFDTTFIYPRYADLLANKLTLNFDPIKGGDLDSDPSTVVTDSWIAKQGDNRLIKLRIANEDRVVTFPGFRIDPECLTSLYRSSSLDRFLLTYASILFQMKQEVIAFATTYSSKSEGIDSACFDYLESMQITENRTNAKLYANTIVQELHIEYGMIDIDFATHPTFVFFQNPAAYVRLEDLTTPNPDLLNWQLLNAHTYYHKPCLGCFHHLTLAKPAMYFEHLSTASSSLSQRYRNNLFFSSCYAHSHQHFACLRSYVERTVYSISSKPKITTNYMIQWTLKQFEKRYRFDPDTNTYDDYIHSVYIPGYGPHTLPPPALIAPGKDMADMFKSSPENAAKGELWNNSGYDRINELYSEPFFNNPEVLAQIEPTRQARLEDCAKLDKNGADFAYTQGHLISSYNDYRQWVILTSPVEVTAVNTVEPYAPTHVDIVTPEFLDIIKDKKDGKLTYDNVASKYPRAVYGPRWKSLLTYYAEHTALEIELQNEHMLIDPEYDVIKDCADQGVVGQECVDFSHQHLPQYLKQTNLNKSQDSIKMEVVGPESEDSPASDIGSTFIGPKPLFDEESLSDSDSTSAVLSSPISATTAVDLAEKPLIVSQSPLKTPRDSLAPLTGLFTYLMNSVASPSIDDLVLLFQVNQRSSAQEMFYRATMADDPSDPLPEKSVFSDLASQLVYAPTEQSVLMLAVLRRWSDQCLCILWNFIINQGVNMEDIIYKSDRLGFNIWDYVVMTNIQFSAPQFYELVAPHFPSEPPQ